MKFRSLSCILTLLPLFLIAPANAQDKHHDKTIDTKNAHQSNSTHKAQGKTLHTAVKSPQVKQKKLTWKPSSPNYKAEDSFE